MMICGRISGISSSPSGRGNRLCKTLCSVTTQRNRFPRPDGLEEIPEMRPQIIIVVPPITYALRGRLISRFGIVLVVPALEVGVLQAARKSVAVIAGSQVNPGLRGVAEAKL